MGMGWEAGWAEHGHLSCPRPQSWPSTCQNSQPVAFLPRQDCLSGARVSHSSWVTWLRLALKRWLTVHPHIPQKSSRKVPEDQHDPELDTELCYVFAYMYTAIILIIGLFIIITLNSKVTKIKRILLFTLSSGSSDLRFTLEFQLTLSYLWGEIHSESWALKIFYMVPRWLEMCVKGVPVVVQRKRTWLVSVRMRVQSLASLSGLRIRPCLGLWCRSQTRLRFRVATAVV